MQLPIRLVLSRSMRHLQTTQRASPLQLMYQTVVYTVKKVARYAGLFTNCKVFSFLFHLVAVNNCYPSQTSV